MMLRAFSFGLYLFGCGHSPEHLNTSLEEHRRDACATGVGALVCSIEYLMVLTMSFAS